MMPSRPGPRIRRLLSRRGFWLAAAALVLLTAAVIVVRRLSRPPDLAWQRIQTEQVLTVATDASYPPFSSLDANGNLFGFDVDLADEIGRRWGVQVNYDNITYDALLDTLIAGRDEAVISAFVPQPERTRQVAYTRSYFTSGTVVVVRRLAARPSDLTRRPGPRQDAGGGVRRGWRRAGAPVGQPHDRRHLVRQETADDALLALAMVTPTPPWSTPLLPMPF